MLQHNATQTGRQAHLAHATLVGLHTLCCGLPLLLTLVVSISGAASILSTTSEYFGQFHGFLHQNEVWIVTVSALLVVLGGVLEGRARRAGGGAGFPWLFAVSVLCFFLNTGIVLLHRVV